MKYADLLEQVKLYAPMNWPTIHGSIIAHRMAGARAIRERLEELLQDPSVTRRMLREEMEKVLKEIEEHGP